MHLRKKGKKGRGKISPECAQKEEVPKHTRFSIGKEKRG